MSTTKKCCTCKEELALELFGKNKGRPDGREARCKSCRKANYKANSTELKAKAAEYKEKNRETINAKRRVTVKQKKGPKPITHKVCPVCGVDKPRAEYYKKLTSISHKCKTCSDELTVAERGKYKGMYYDTQRAWHKKKYATDPEYREKVAADKKAYYDRNQPEIRANLKERYATDPEYRAAALAHNKRTKYCQPDWVNPKELRAIYKGCPEGHEVDHIIPLKGRIAGRRVSGLHTPANLQYLSAEANRKKHCYITEADL